MDGVRQPRHPGAHRAVRHRHRGRPSYGAEEVVPGDARLAWPRWWHRSHAKQASIRPVGSGRTTMATTAPGTPCCVANTGFAMSCSTTSARPPSSCRWSSWCCSRCHGEAKVMALHVRLFATFIDLASLVGAYIAGTTPAMPPPVSTSSSSHASPSSASSRSESKHF